MTQLMQGVGSTSYPSIPAIHLPGKTPRGSVVRARRRQHSMPSVYHAESLWGVGEEGRARVGEEGRARVGGRRMV